MAAEEAPLSFRFLGGDADEGQLNFYDASRFYYGAARFVYTLEHFRQTGNVLAKITQRINADYRIATPRPGSWILDVLHIAGPVMTEMAIKVPLDVMMAYVMELVTPGSKSRDTLVRLAEERTEQDRERTAQERERTRQERERTRQLRLLTRTNEQALGLVDDLLKNRLARDTETRAMLKEIKREISASQTRENLIANYNKEFEKISSRTADRLINRTSSQVSEIGKPLIRSASQLRIRSGTRAPPFANLNRRTIEQLSGNIEDPTPTSLVGSVVRYDKENGWGKFRSREFTVPVSFVVPSSQKNELNFEVIDAMKEEGIGVSFYYVRNRRGVVKYLVFDHLIEIE